MRNIGNILWFIFGGLLGGLAWFFAGCIWCITIIGIPVGLQCFNLRPWHSGRLEKKSCMEKKMPGNVFHRSNKSARTSFLGESAVRSSFFCLKKYAIMPSPIEYHETPLL